MKQVKRMKQVKQMEQEIKEMTKGIDLSDCLLDFTKDYREVLEHYTINEHGDLMVLRGNKWHILIERERLSEDDWISHRKGKCRNFGEFVAAYLKACELAGITELSIRLYEFSCSYRYANE